MPAARYDGHAEWYDEWRAGNVAGTAEEAAALLGPGVKGLVSAL